jgi:hypothetical protein
LIRKSAIIKICHFESKLKSKIAKVKLRFQILTWKNKRENTVILPV